MKRFLILTGVLVLLSNQTAGLGQARELGPQAITFVVNSNGTAPDVNPGDGICDTAGWVDYCTLRAAIQEANLSSTPPTIKFAAPMTISPSSLPPITKDGVVIDGSDRWDGTWPGGRPGVKISGANYANGILQIQADSVVVYGIEFSGANSVGVYISGSGGNNVIGGPSTGMRNVFLSGTGVRINSSGTGNVVSGNYFGTWDGENAVASYRGVLVESDRNDVTYNLIMGHTSDGILVSSGDRNVLANNTIGTNKLETVPRPNALGISISDGRANLILDSIICGNTGRGVDLLRANDTIIDGNEIGDTPSGLGNGDDGIHAVDTSNIRIGAQYGNLVAGNSGYGIWLSGDGNYIEGNTIAGNGQDGVYIESGQENRVGSSSGSARNKIRSNSGHGVHLATGAISTTVRGNTIGLSSNNGDAGNGGHGILIEGGASANRIGGLGSSDGNWIGFNDWSGIYISGGTTRYNVLEGNVIGAPADWSRPAPNGHHGIGIYDGAYNNWIGWGNTIVSSNWSGVAIVNGSDYNVVWYNYIGTNDTGDDWGNAYWGVSIVNSTENFLFGNEIAYNGQDGVRVDGSCANPFHANSIHDNSGDGIELVNGGNLGLAAPTITLASCFGQPQTPGVVQGTACPGCTVEIFSDLADEGRTFEGSTEAHATTGAFSWNGMLVGPNVTATNTKVGATSPFSTPTSTGVCVTPKVFVPLVQR